MSAPATSGGGGGGGKSGGRDRKAKAGGAAGKGDNDSRTGGGGGGGESRGKSIPLAGRPLFTSVASTKVKRMLFTVPLLLVLVVVLVVSLVGGLLSLRLLSLVFGQKRAPDTARLPWW